MVQLSTRKWEIRGGGRNRHEKLGFKRISCESQFTIPDTAGTSRNPAGNNTDTRSSKPNQANRIPDFSGSLVSSISFSSSSPISLCLVHNSTIIARTQSWVIPLYLSMPSSWVNTECSIDRVQHTPSTAYTEYSIHRVQHTPSTAYTKYSIHQVQHTPKIVCRPFILKISSRPLNVASASGVPPYRSTATSQFSKRASKVKSLRHIPTVGS